MVLKKLFHSEKVPVRPATSLGNTGAEAEEQYLYAAEPNLDTAGLPSPGFPSPGFRPEQSFDVDHHFEQIEKQFEDLHDQLDSRPHTSLSGPFAQAHLSSQPLSNGRHVDLLDALARSQQHQAPTSQTFSPPSSPYNEDIAERNMTRFLRIQHRKGYASSRTLSALYQEDVADRNIAKYSNPIRSLSSLSCRSSPAAPGRVRSPEGSKRKPWKRTTGKSSWTSEEDLRSKSRARAEATATLSSGHLRVQKSAPSLSTSESSAEEDAVPDPVQRLGVPAAYKQGKRWSNTPLPDSPTLPVPVSGGGGGGGAACESPVIPGRPPALTARSSSLKTRTLAPRTLAPPSSPGASSKKNVRELSINTQLAAKGRAKIAHKAIQPPTPSNYEIKRAPSIAEVMGSPLPEPSPSSISPRFKVSEMMDLFNKAYMSTQAVSPHPTYETLQDAIVREINSHEAFQRVPVPTAGPPFTPSSGQDSFAKENQLSKLRNKNSFRKHRQNPESRRSISTILPSKVLRKVSASPVAARRRHTDAPPPSPGLLADIQNPTSTESMAPRPATGDQLTYMDVLFRASNDKPSTSSGPKPTSTSRRRGGSESTTANLSSIVRTIPDTTPHTPGTVYCLQAHSTPSKDSQTSEDSDDEIIHLPSVTGLPPPRVQIEGVDENNVRYVIDSASPVDAQKLMSWPQRARRDSKPNKPSNTSYQTSLSPLSRARMQLRASRSVDTY
ncbi:hypothetical protein N7510_007691 [Penicillium lagena]|uniref:uncharacterized protein n=1 Tax=Penicillium lagena TaxID=94218 RepID=UPI00254231A9|nr:uncharacterized protein N7510_007691 [Penicillium lagena]KAJ5610972.1 hypothetical protein N7510_007691 [Penicillium lagena]